MSEVKVKNIFITGGNRGIGLGLVTAMLEQFQPDHLFATYRDAGTSQALLDLGKQTTNVHPIQFDVTDYSKFPAIIQEVDTVTKGAGINLLINNSGILGKEYRGIYDVTRDDIVKHMEINMIAPVIITQAFAPLLEKAAEENEGKEGIERAVLVNISTAVASIAENSSGGVFSYRVSKTALNMATKSISLDLQKSGITTLLIHPGWVKTDMGTDKATLTTEDSVTGILNVLKGVTSEMNGKFIRYNGTEIPW